MVASEKEVAFSWGRAIGHWLAAWLVVAALIVGIGAFHGIADPNKLSYDLGELLGKLLLPALGISYLAQTGRRNWALGIAGLMLVLTLVGIVTAINLPPPVAKIKTMFTEGCAARCPPEVGTARCSAWCGCVWDGVRAAHPGDRAVAEFFRSEHSERERFITELSTQCAARFPAP